MRKRLLYWIGGIVLAIIIIGAFSDWIVKALWLSNVGYEQVFWTIKETQFLLFAAALIVALAYVLPNMHYLSKQLPGFNLNLGQTPLGQVNIQKFTTRQIRIFLYSAGTLLSLFFSFAYYTQWDAFFRFNWDVTFGKVDPLFGHDIGFYVFRLPFIQTIQNSLTILVFFVTIILLVIYLASGSLSLQKTGDVSRIQASAVVRRHIGINIGLWLLLLAWGYFLERYHLLYEGSGVVYGADYTDTHVLLPVLWVMTILCIVLAIIALYQCYRARIGWFVKGAFTIVGVGIIGQIVLPPLIQNLSVEPNELQLETPYINNNIDQTRQAYDLDTFNTRDYNAADTLTFSRLQNNSKTLQNIRLWDPRLIKQTYRQLQEIRLYYQFFNVQLDRYHTNKGYKQVMVSARELSNELPAKAQTWLNQHLQYTHGYGLVMSPVSEVKKQGDPEFYIKDLPPASSVDLPVKQAAIYYGENHEDYKLVNTNVKELDYPKGDKNVYTNYQGSGGVSIDNFFEQLLFSWEFGDYNLLLTDYIRNGSKIQFWQNIQTRIDKIAPFLKMEDDPYPVLSNGHMYWIQDAYTTSSDYPYSQPYNGQYNYIRNSVKIVVDAYDGSVNLYTTDPADPILKVYRNVFPDLFKPLDAMPDQLRQHVRYPKHLFKVQMNMFNTYHMTNPQVFYNNEDLWTRPNEKYGGRKIKLDPYYILSALPGDDKLQYLLISPLTPNNRDNMIAWMAAKSDMPQYGDVEIFKLPKERLFLGPAQIEAKIDQATDISRQLSLWDQRGSKVIRGNLIVIPIDNSFLYVEPVFLIAQGVDIPQLQRVIATTGDRVVMEKTLNGAIETLFGKQPKQAAKTAETPTQQVSVPQPQNNQQLQQLKSLWDDLQTALQNQDWQTFGEKMQAIKKILNKTTP